MIQLIVQQTSVQLFNKRSKICIKHAMPALKELHTRDPQTEEALHFINIEKKLYCKRHPNWPRALQKVSLLTTSKSSPKKTNYKIHITDMQHTVVLDCNSTTQLSLASEKAIEKGRFFQPTPRGRKYSKRWLCDQCIRDSDVKRKKDQKARDEAKKPTLPILLVNIDTIHLLMLCCRRHSS